eukprot:351948-Chlamydomonas_euryale.AAC.7
MAAEKAAPTLPSPHTCITAPLYAPQFPFAHLQQRKPHDNAAKSLVRLAERAAHRRATASRQPNPCQHEPRDKASKAQQLGASVQRKPEPWPVRQHPPAVERQAGRVVVD